MFSHLLLNSDGLRLTPFAGQVELLVSRVSVSVSKGAFNNYVDKVKGGGGQKMSVFVHAQCIKTVHAGGGSKMEKFCPCSC